jgi:MFS family permease
MKARADEIRSEKFGLNRNVFYMGITSFLTDTASKMIYSVMPLFLMSLGATKTELSIIEGIAESTASVIKAVSGRWSDKIRKNKPFMIVGYALAAVLSPLFAIAATPIHILMIRFTERVGKGIRSAPRDSLIASSSDSNTKGRSFGFHKAMDNSGAILGPLLATGILLLFPKQYRVVFIVAFLPAMIGLIALIRFVRESREVRAKSTEAFRLRDFPLKYYALLGIVFFFTLGNSTDALLLIKAGDVGVQIALIPIVYMITSVVSVLAAVPIGMLSDKIGRERLIIFGYLLYSAVYFGFGRTGSQITLVLLFALYGLYSASTDGIQKALVSDIIDKDKLGTGLGIYNSLVGITLLPASLIAGLLYDNVDNRAPFYFGSIMALVAAILMLLYYRKNSRGQIKI